MTPAPVSLEGYLYGDDMILKTEKKTENAGPIETNVRMESKNWEKS